VPAPAQLHIGTLEVRVLAPAAPPPPAAAPRMARAAAVRGPANSNAGLSRPFGVFGLGQS
jgi:hypothetical protein